MGVRRLMRSRLHWLIDRSDHTRILSLFPAGSLVKMHRASVDECLLSAQDGSDPAMRLLDITRLSPASAGCAEECSDKGSQWHFCEVISQLPCLLPLADHRADQDQPPEAAVSNQFAKSLDPPGQSSRVPVAFRGAHSDRRKASRPVSGGILAL